MMGRFRSAEQKQSDARGGEREGEEALRAPAVPGAISARDFKSLCLDLGVHRASLTTDLGAVRFSKAVEWWTSASVERSLQQLQYALHIFDRLDVEGKEELHFSEYSRLCHPRVQQEMLRGAAPPDVIDCLRRSLVDWKITTCVVLSLSLFLSLSLSLCAVRTTRALLSAAAPS